MILTSRKNTVFLIIILFGIILRFYNLNYDNLWYDEIISFWVANPEHSIKESYNFHKQIEIAPFTFNLILRSFFQIFGYEVDFARYLPCFFSIASIFLVYKISKEIDGENLYLLPTFLTSFNIFLIGFAQEQRVYSLLIFFTLASILFFFKCKSENVKIFDLSIFFLLTLILVFLHLFSLFILFSFLLYSLLIYLKNKENFFKLNCVLLVLTLVSALFYVPYVLSFSTDLNLNLDVNYSWNKNPSLKFLTNFYFSNYFGSRLIGIIFLLTFFIVIFQNKKFFFALNKPFLLFIIIFTSYFIPILFGFLFKPILLSRYISYVPILVILLISSLLLNSKNKKFKIFFSTILIIGTIGNMFTEEAFRQFVTKRIPSKPQYIEAIKYINSSGEKLYTLKVEKMKNDEATIKSINNYIDHLSSKHNFQLNFVNLNNIKDQSLWVFCPMDINDKTCPVPNQLKEFKILEEKYFNNINLKLIKM